MGVNLRPSRWSKQESSLRVKLFITAKENSVSDRWWWPYTSLLFETLKITSKFYSIRILELIQKRDHLSSNSLFILFDLFFTELRQISSTLIIVIYFFKIVTFFRLMKKFLHWFYKMFQLYKFIALIISSVLLQHISEKNVVSHHIRTIPFWGLINVSFLECSYILSVGSWLRAR